MGMSLGGLEDRGLEADPFLEAAAGLQVEKLSFLHFSCVDLNSILRVIAD